MYYFSVIDCIVWRSFQTNHENKMPKYKIMGSITLTLWEWSNNRIEKCQISVVEQCMNAFAKNSLLILWDLREVECKTKTFASNNCEVAVELGHRLLDDEQEKKFWRKGWISDEMYWTESSRCSVVGAVAPYTGTSLKIRSLLRNIEINKLEEEKYLQIRNRNPIFLATDDSHKFKLV